MYVNALLLLLNIPDQNISYLINHKDILTKAFLIHIIVFAIFSTKIYIWFFSQGKVRMEGKNQCNPT